MSADEGLVHLQAAAKEMVAAARSFLDAVEDVVDDDERLGKVVSGLTDVLHQATHAVSNLSDRSRPDTGPEPRVRRIVVD